MRVVLSASVESDLDRRLHYTIENFGHATAQRIFQRVDAFLNSFLPAHPRGGKWIAEAGLYEDWIARTPFIIMYRLDEAAKLVTVVAIFHHAQDRSDFEPEADL